MDVFEHAAQDRVFWRGRAKVADLVALDTETTSLDAMRAEIVGVSFSVRPGEAAYVPLAHNYPGAAEQLPREQVLPTTTRSGLLSSMCCGS